MPIIDLTLVLAPGTAPPAGLAQRVADVAGDLLGAAAGHLWVRLDSWPTERYAENHAVLAADELPAFVRILHARPPTGAALDHEVQVLTRALAECLARPPTAVHLEYAPAGAGRMAFGGRLVPRDPGGP
jgi:phenylpyruvate tautomerase PptA (4-oxalocrotonate tautomerase family)